MAIIGDCDYWSYPSGRSVRLYTNGCVVDSGTGLMGPCTQMGVLCLRGHGTEPFNSVFQNGKELLAVCCMGCKDIKLVDMETQQVISIFKYPTDSLDCLCSGPNDSLFVGLRSGNVWQLDRSFSVTNTLNLSSFVRRGFCFAAFTFMSICYLPGPHILVVNNRVVLRAVSLLDGNLVWNQECEAFRYNCLLYCPQQDILLVSAFLQPQVHILNPSNGLILQTIRLPNIYSITQTCLSNNQIAMIQRDDESELRLFSCYSVKRVV